MEYSKTLLQLIARMNKGEKKILERVETFGWEDYKVKQWLEGFNKLNEDACEEYLKVNK